MDLNPDQPFELAKQQLQEFLEKVQDRNKSEARLIVAKYDLKNSYRKPLRDYPDDFVRAFEEMKAKLEERQKFLNLLADYL